MIHIDKRYHLNKYISPAILATKSGCLDLYQGIFLANYFLIHELITEIFNLDCSFSCVFLARLSTPNEWDEIPRLVNDTSHVPTGFAYGNLGKMLMAQVFQVHRFLMQELWCLWWYINALKTTQRVFVTIDIIRDHQINLISS